LFAICVLERGRTPGAAVAIFIGHSAEFPGKSPPNHNYRGSFLFFFKYIRAHSDALSAPSTFGSAIALRKSDEQAQK
jgi:hypothetical protein